MQKAMNSMIEQASMPDILLDDFNRVYCDWLRTKSDNTHHYSSHYIGYNDLKYQFAN